MRKLFCLSIVFIGLSVCPSSFVNAQGVGINPSGNPPANSAILDVSATDKGMLIPRLTTTERDAIPNPAQWLMIINTTTNCFETWANGLWQTVWCAACPTPAQPSAISGSTSPCESSSQTYSVTNVNGVTYTWSFPSGWTPSTGSTNSVTVTVGAGSGNIQVTPSNNCGNGTAQTLVVTSTAIPAAPTAGTNTPSASQIVWNWNTVSGATGYKYNTANDYSSAIDNGTNTSYTQTGLSCGTNNSLYVWAYNGCGSSSATTLNQTTGSCCTSNTWTRMMDFGGVERVYDVGFSIGTKGYIGTGSGASSYKDFWEWDQASNTWSQKADFGGTARAGAVGFSIGTKGYIGTGGNAKDFWEWDQAGNTWTRKADFGGTARDNAVGFSIGSKGYIGTGTSGGKEFWEWDQVSNTWTRKADFGGSARSHAAGFSIGNKGYIGTGTVWIRDFWEWDQASDTWTQKADFGGSGRHAPMGFSIGTKGYIGTGFDGSQRRDFWEWDQASNIWTQKADFGGPGMNNGAGFSIGTKGYIGTGNNTKDFWEWCQ